MRMSSVAPVLLFGLFLGGCDYLASLDARRDAKKRAQASAEAPPAAATKPSTPTTAKIPPVIASRPLPKASPQPEADNAAFASTDDLVLLSALLEVPVSGVARAELRDTYAEPRGTRLHEAMDILALRGTPVVSAVDGRLLKLFNSKAGGLMVYATDPSRRFILLYGHLDRYADGLANGMMLKRGQVIGYVGTTGNAPPNTPHLHFGILRGNPDVSWSKGDPVNPYLLFNPAR